MVPKGEFNMDHIDSMKYADLQKLAKKLGIKANMKADKLVKALKHFIELQGGTIKQDLSSAEETETETSGSDQDEGKQRKTKGRGRRVKKVKKNVKEGEKTKTSDEVTQNERNIRKSEKVQTPNLPSAIKKAGNSVQRKSKTQTPITGRNVTPGKRRSYTLKTPVVIAKGSAKAKVLSQGKKRKQTQSPVKEKTANKEITSVGRRSSTKKAAITPTSVVLTRKSGSIGSKNSKSRTPSSRSTTPATTKAIKSRVSFTVTSAPSSSKRLSAGMKRKRSKTPSDKQREIMDTKKRKVETPSQDKVSKEIPENGDKSEQAVSEKSEQVETPTRRQSARLSNSGVTDMMNSLTDNMSDAEMKAALMSALEKRVEDCKSKGWNPEPTHIPRFSGLHKTQSMKQVTPGNKDWDKIHKKHFDKMDSLDVYLKKKRQRATSLNASVKKLKAMTEDMKSALTSLKKHRTPTTAERKTTIAKKSARSTVSMFQSPAVPFIPKVKSTKKMNLNFSSLTKTPIAPPAKAKVVSVARKITPKTATKATSQVKSPKFATTELVRSKSRVSGEKENVGKRSSAAADRWKCDSVTKKSAVTPFSGRLESKNESSTKKNAFNLQASLCRPITWNMHKGTLKPFMGDRSLSHRTNVKDVKVLTREDRRTKARMHRADKRSEKQMKQRGIMA